MVNGKRHWPELHIVRFGIVLGSLLGINCYTVINGK